MVIAGRCVRLLSGATFARDFRERSVTEGSAGLGKAVRTVTLRPGSSGSVRILDVAGNDYRRAFELFMAGTDEKVVTHEYLKALVEQLPRRTLFLDVGAGDGVTTRYVGQYFERTIAIEPSAPMRQVLRRSCPDAVVLNEPIDKVELDVRADLALCAHVLYYVPDFAWLDTVRRILNWVAPGGTLLLMLQNPENDCMRMVRHFTGVRHDLSSLARRLEHDGNGLVDSVAMVTLPIRYRSTNLADAIDVAEFMINVPALRSRRLPSRQELQNYVVRNFSDPEGAICINHTHDILTARRALDVLTG